MGPLDPDDWRGRFPVLERANYLVSHSLGAMPEGVREKLEAYADQWASRGVRAWAEGWWSTPADVGDELGRILKAPPGTVTMHQNVSIVQAIVASALDFSGRRNKVVLTDQEFPSVAYAWGETRRLGARIQRLESEDGIGVSTERLIEAIDEETAIVPISHVSYRSSFLQDAEAITRRAHEVGALVLLDAYQSAGTIPIDALGLGVDMICGGSVKWLCGGPGAAFLYVREGLIGSLEPRITGWAGHADPFAFADGPQRYSPGSMRFLQGTPAVPALLAATAGFETILEIGVERIRAHSMRSTERLRENLIERGFRCPMPEDPMRRGGTVIVALREDECGPAFVRALDRRGIVVDHRPAAGIRVGPHFYNREDELDELAEALADLRCGMGWKEYVGGTARVGT